METWTVSRSHTHTQKMKFDIHIAPNTEEEVELLEQLSEAREFGIEETSMTESEIAAVYAQFASGIHTEEEEDEQESYYEFSCPVCDGVVKDVQTPGMGQNPIIKPCGHESDWADIPLDYFEEE